MSAPSTETAYKWVIEILEGKVWSPTVGGGLNRADARRDLVEWKVNNPGDSFRLRKYRRINERT